jgi:nucleoside-diphosphate-sugar epimerase
VESLVTRAAMKILVTGNLGYVGPWVMRHLRAQYPEATLVGIDAGFFAHCLTNAQRLPETDLDVQHFADIRRPPAGLLAGVAAVVHLAAVSNDPMGHAYEDVTLDVNYRAGVELARHAKAAGAHAFIFASSCSVYGSADEGPRTERSEVRPLTTYARSKVLAEEGLGALADSNFRVTCLRFATACGMSDRLRLDLVLNDFVASAISAGRITVLSDGTPWRPLINVQDMARAICWAVEREADAGGDFLVINTGSDGWNHQVRELADAVAHVVPGTKVSINRAAPPDKRSYRVDFSLFRTLAPRHQPVADLVGTIEGLRQGLEAMQFRDVEFRNSSLVRLRVLGDLERRNLLSSTLEWRDRSARTLGYSEPLLSR